MKFDIRKMIWASALGVAIAGLGAPKLAVAAQPGQDQDQNTSSTTNSLFQQGLSNGQEDGANNRVYQYRLHPDNDSDRHAYESGYDQGYQNNSRSGANRGQNRDANGNYAGQYGQYGSNGNVAAQQGFQDGANDGLQDRQGGHSSRATKHESYEHGDRGYTSSFGDKGQYQSAYRQAYIQGYERGYSGQSSQNNRRDADDRGANGNYNGQYGQYGPNGNLAAQNGYQDGANAGLQDRQGGHSSRATKHESYEHADRGYTSSFGGKDQFKASYRQAYIQGYQRGYNSQDSDNRR